MGSNLVILANQTILMYYIQNRYTYNSNESDKSIMANFTSAPIDYYYDLNRLLQSLTFAVLFFLVFIVGIVSNLLIIFVFLFRNEFRQYTNYFFANLSFTDILVLLVCIPIAITDLFSPNIWYYGYIYCNIKILIFKRV